MTKPRCLLIVLILSGVIILLAPFLSVYSVYDIPRDPSSKNHTRNNIIAVNSSLGLFHIPDTSFGSTINLSNNNGHSKDPKLVINGNYLYVIWVDDTLGNRDIFLRRSTDNGTTFSKTINLSNHSGGSSDPQIAVSGSNVYVAWEYTPGNNGEIFFTRSTDSGASFEKAINIGNNTGFNGLPQLAASGSKVYLVWHDVSHGVLFKRSVDYGASFERAITLSSKDKLSFHPHIVAVFGSNNVYVVWINSSEAIKSTYDIVFRRSTDSGASFERAITLSSKDKLSFHPHIVAVSGSNNVYVVWYNGTAVNDSPTLPPTLLTDIIYTRSVDNGASFERAITVSNYAGWSTSPQIAVSKIDNVYVVWQSNPHGKNGEIVFSRSTDTGASFERAITLSNKTTDSSYPQIAVSQSDNVYVVWQSNPHGKNGEIVFSRSTDTGASFERAITLSNKTTDSCYPQIVVSQSDNVYVVWDENATLNNEIVLLRNPPYMGLPKYTGEIRTIEDAVPSGRVHETINVGVVHPTFTDAAYDKSFYLFYGGEKAGLAISHKINNTKYTNLLSNTVNNRLLEISSVVKHLKWLSPRFNVTAITDVDVDSNFSIFTKKGTNKYDIIILDHQEYVTQQEYDHLKQFVEKGGIMILMDGNVFYAEVKYDKKSNTITLVRGHGWAFNGKYASESVFERWANETSQWVGSNYLCCYGDVIRFANNPFNYIHNEEQYITNPNATILLNYNATVLKRTSPHSTNASEVTIATYEMNYKKGKVISIGLFSDGELFLNDRFNSFFDSLLLQNTLGAGNGRK